MEHMKISKMISEYLITRDTIRKLFDQINNLKDNDIEIDFNGVSFISMSCADEYQKQKALSKKKIEEINIVNDVKLMMQAIKSRSNAAKNSKIADISPVLL
jgi:hypothetical protein